MKNTHVLSRLALAAGLLLTASAGQAKTPTAPFKSKAVEVCSSSAILVRAEANLLNVRDQQGLDTEIPIHLLGRIACARASVKKTTSPRHLALDAAMILPSVVQTYDRQIAEQKHPFPPDGDSKMEINPYEVMQRMQMPQVLRL